MKFSLNVYQKQLYKFLIPAGLVLLTGLAGIGGYLFFKWNQKDYIYYVNSSSENLEQTIGISATIIQRSIQEAILDESILKWAAASADNERAFLAIQAKKQLQAITTDSTLVDYDLAVTTLPAVSGSASASSSMVLKQNGTVAAGDFFDEKGFSREQMEFIYAHFSSGNTPLTFPGYDENGDLDSLYYITRSSWISPDLMCIASIPASLFQGAGEEAFFITKDKRLLACSRDGKDCLPADGREQEAVFGMETEGIQLSERGYVLTINVPYFGRTIFYTYQNFIPSFSQILLFILTFLAFGILLMFALLRLAEALYRPIRSAISAFADTDETHSCSSGPIDELMLIRKNSEKIQALNQSLTEAVAANNRLVSSQLLRKMLFSPVLAPETEALLPESKSYAVALIEFKHPEETASFSAVMVLKEAIREFALSHESVYYCDIDHIKAALIIQGDKTEDIKNSLFSLGIWLKEQEETENIRHWTALSNSHPGGSQLYKGYQEALNILEYKHLYNHSSILTFDQIAMVDTFTYSYPLSVESRLVACIIDGKEEALLLFDSLIRTNLLNKTLSAEALQSFVYALIGTLGRIFRELKTSPEDFLSREVPFKSFYEHWNDSVTITQLRRTLSDIIAAVKNNQSSNDQKMLSEMIAYIRSNYSDDIMLNDMAEHFNVSPKYCGILFKQLSDNNFKDYLNRYRIEKAKEFLTENPNLKIAELSHMVGFNSANSFIRVFSKYVGTTPKTFAEHL